MKASIFLFALPLASAWTLELTARDGRQISMSGHHDSGCEDITFSPVLNVNRARFSPQTDYVEPDPRRFELYTESNCRDLAFGNRGGTYRFRARRIRSYKVL